MSKVVHLSTDAHTEAKEYCERHGLKMSQWVARLIHDAMRGEDGQNALAPAWEERRRLPAEAEGVPATGEDEPAFAAPPFWDPRGPT